MNQFDKVHTNSLDDPEVTFLGFKISYLKYLVMSFGIGGIVYMFLKYKACAGFLFSSISGILAPLSFMLYYLLFVAARYEGFGRDVFESIKDQNQWVLMKINSYETEEAVNYEGS